MLKYTRGVAGVTGKAREREVVSNTWAHLPNLWPEDICYGGGGHISANKQAHVSSRQVLEQNKEPAPGKPLGPGARKGLEHLAHSRICPGPPCVL